MPEIQNPYAPKNQQVPTGPVFPTARLRRLGASPEQLAQMGGSWDGWETARRLQFATDLSVMTDQQVLDMLAELQPEKPAARRRRASA